MSDKTKAELKEQIKIMNHNYQTIKEMHDRGYRCSISEIEKLKQELETTRKALDVAVGAVKSIQEYGAIAMSELQKNGLGGFQKPVSKMQDMAHLAEKQINEITNEHFAGVSKKMEQKEQVMAKQKLKPFDYAFAKMLQEKLGVKFVDSKGKPIEFVKTEQKE